MKPERTTWEQTGFKLTIIRESHKIEGHRVQGFTERFQCDSLREELEFQALKIRLTTGIL